MSPGDNSAITALTKGPDGGWIIEPASATRQWMDETQQRFAYKCLPIVMANQAGWVVRIPGGVRATWKGGDGMGEMKIQVVGGPDHFKNQVVGTFGHGIISFTLPWLFRTPEGVGLLVRGVPNTWRAGAVPLEGVVETDWATQAFTMNWRVTTPNKPVVFRAGDPICMLAPFPMDLAESLEPEKKNIREEPEIAAQFAAHIAERKRRHAASRELIAEGRTEYDRTHWKLDYLKGKSATGERADQHRTNFKLKPFPGQDG